MHGRAWGVDAAMDAALAVPLVCRVLVDSLTCAGDLRSLSLVAKRFSASPGPDDVGDPERAVGGPGTGESLRRRCVDLEATEADLNACLDASDTPCALARKASHWARVVEGSPTTPANAMGRRWTTNILQIGHGLVPEWPLHSSTSINAT